MTGRNRKIEIAREAEIDLLGIGRFTETNWGAHQRKAYLSEIEKNIKALARNPGQGTPRNEIMAGLRSWPCGRHLIFYCVNADFISIIRILHQNMDIDSWLGID